MKNWMISAPLVVLLASAAVVQAAGTEKKQPEGSGIYGNAWSESVGSAFMVMDNDKMTMRSDADLATGWTALSQPDRDMVKADCTTFQAELAAGTANSAEATGTLTDDATTGADKSGGTGGDAAPKLALSVEDMTRLCTKVMGM